MNKIVIFFGGVIIGGLIGVIGTSSYFKDKYHKFADEEIEEMKKYYKKKYGGVIKNEEVESVSENKEDVKEVSENEKVVYNGFFNKPVQVEYEDIDPAEMESPMEDECSIIDEQMDEFHKKNWGKEPEIISDEEVGELPPGIERKDLYLYTYDYTLTDENDNEIEDPDKIVGRCLEQYDFYDSDDRSIYVINYNLHTLYEVQKVDASFEYK